MYKLFVSEIRRHVRSRIFRWMMIAVSIGFNMLTGGAMKLGEIAFGKIHPTPEIIFSMVPTIMPVLIGVYVIISENREFSEGTIRNKLVSGSKRGDILTAAVLSQVMCMVAAATVFVLFSLASGRILFGDFGITMNDIIALSVVYLLASAALTVFYTGIQFIIGNSRSVIVISLVIALANQTIAGELFRKLYPESGECSLSGIRFSMLSIYDRFIPFAYFTGPVRYDMWIYVVGAVLFSTMSFAVSSIIFERTDIR